MLHEKLYFVVKHCFGVKLRVNISCGLFTGNNKLGLCVCVRLLVTYAARVCAVL